MGNSKRLVLVAVALVLVLLGVAASKGAISGAQAAGLVGSLMMLVLMGPFVARQLAEHPGGALRDILLWLAAFVAVAVIYTNRHAFGF